MEIKPYPNNPKKHPASQVDKIAKSLETVGFTIPILVDGKGTIVAGEGRFLAATKVLKWTEFKEANGSKPGDKFIPYKIVDYLSDDLIKAYRLMDNESAKSSDDRVKLAEEILSLDPKFQAIIGVDIDKEKFEFEKEFDKHTNETADYPIVPKFSEKYDAFIIVSNNEIDTENLIAVLDLSKAKSYKSGIVGRTHVIEASELLNKIAQWKESL